jgi:hypothetical protein
VAYFTPKGRPVCSEKRNLELGYQKIPLNSREDACYLINKAEKEYCCFDLSESKDPDKQLLNISKNTSIKFNIDFDIKFIQTKCSIEVENLNSTEKQFLYTLPGMHKYHAFKLENDFGFAWKVT